MSDDVPDTTPGAPRSPGVVAGACVLAWLVPGAGHAFLGRPRRGVLFLGLVVLAFGVGLALEGRLSRPVEGSYLSVLATFADLGVGTLYAGARLLGLGEGNVAAATHEIGNTFHWAAGLMNMLLVLDAFDVAVGRK